MHYPAWTTDPHLTEDEQKSVRLGFLINICAAYHNASGSLQLLCDAMGVTTQAIRAAITRGYLTAPMAMSLESLIGRDVITKEDLCPEKFKS